MQMQSLERRRESRAGSPVSEGHLMGSKSNLFYSRRPRPYWKYLLLVCIAAALLLLVAHRQREKRVLGLLLEDHGQELNSLQALLQKEKEISEAMKRKIKELTLTVEFLKYQKVELSEKLSVAENVAAYLQQRQTEMDFDQESTRTEIRALREVESEFAKAKNEMKVLKGDLDRKSDEIESMRNRLELLSSKQENATVVGSGTNTSETVSSDVVEHGKGQNDGPQNATVVGSGVNMNEALSSNVVEHGEGRNDEQQNAAVVVSGVVANETLSSDAVEYGKVQNDERQEATVVSGVPDVVEHGEARYDEQQHATIAESNIRMNEDLANVAGDGEARYGEWQNATVLGSGIRMNNTVSSNATERREAQFGGQQLKDINLKVKPTVSETLIFKGDEQHEGPPREGGLAKTESHPESDGGSRENIEKKVAQPKQIEESEVLGTSVENKEQTGKQTDGDGIDQVTEDLSVPNETDGQEPQNSTYVRLEISGDPRHGEKPEVASKDGMGQEDGSQPREEHASPIKQRRRGRKMLPKRKVLAVTVTDSRKEVDDNGHPNGGKSLEGTGEAIEAVANQENSMTPNIGETKGGVTDVQSGITSDGGKMTELGHGNEMYPTADDSLRREIHGDAATTYWDSGVDREGGKYRKQRRYSAANTGVPSGMLELADYDDGGHDDRNSTHSNHATLLNDTGTEVATGMPTVTTM